MPKLEMQPYWRSKDGNHVIYHGDCLEILPTLPKVDAVITDPPYGIGAARGSHSNLKMIDEDWDDAPADVKFIVDSGLPAVIWGGNYFVLPASRCFLFWDKHPMPPSYACGELAWTTLDRNAAKWCGRVGDDVPVKDRSHPTQKPVGLMKWCLGFLPDAETILDPFMGSGTTGVACIRTGRKFIGIEIEKKYCDIAVERMERESLKSPEQLEYENAVASLPKTGTSHDLLKWIRNRKDKLRRK